MKLCYVEPPWAYFTSQDLDQQWGDDWNDKPFEHNAGRPYEDSGWQIVKLAYDADLQTPADGQWNSPYSVQDINKGTAPWLTDWEDTVAIMAGTSIDMFRTTIKALGGHIYSQETE